MCEFVTGHIITSNIWQWWLFHIINSCQRQKLVFLLCCLVFHPSLLCSLCLFPFICSLLSSLCPRGSDILCLLGIFTKRQPLLVSKYLVQSCTLSSLFNSCYVHDNHWTLINGWILVSEFELNLLYVFRVFPWQLTQWRQPLCSIIQVNLHVVCNCW